MTDKRTADVVALVAATLDVPADQIGEDAGMATIAKWDSVAQLNICLAFQERFGIDMDMETIAAATCVTALAKLLPEGI
jgi:acyl carrier protein